TPASECNVGTCNDSCDAEGRSLPESTITCADADPCTTDTCDPLLGCGSAPVPAPSSQCVGDHSGAIDLRAGATSATNKLGWQWKSKRSPTPAEVGDPTDATDY